MVMIPRERQGRLQGHNAQTVDVDVDVTTTDVPADLLFVTLLGASNYFYLEATGSQQLPPWMGSNVRALGFYRGCTELRSENLRSVCRRSRATSRP